MGKGLVILLKSLGVVFDPVAAQAVIDKIITDAPGMIEGLQAAVVSIEQRLASIEAKLDAALAPVAEETLP